MKDKDEDLKHIIKNGDELANVLRSLDEDQWETIMESMATITHCLTTVLNKLTPEQRSQVFETISSNLTPQETANSQAQLQSIIGQDIDYGSSAGMRR